MRVCCGSRRGRCVLFTNILDSLTVPCLVYNTAMYRDTAGAASMAGAWFIHWQVRPVRGLYGPVLTGCIYIPFRCRRPPSYHIIPSCIHTCIPRGALHIQDRSPQSRPVASLNQSQTHCDATGHNCGGDRSWIWVWVIDASAYRRSLS